MTTVLNARDLQNRYMFGSGSAALIDASEFNATYGRYAIYAAANEFERNLRNHGGQIGALAQTGTLEGVTVSNFITDIHSPDYLDRALGYGAQRYNVDYVIRTVDGHQTVDFTLRIADEDYNFTGSNQHIAEEAVRQAAGYLLDPLGLGSTFNVRYTGVPPTMSLSSVEVAQYAYQYEVLTAEGRGLRDNVLTFEGFSGFAGLVFDNAGPFFTTFPEAAVTAAASTALAFFVAKRIALSSVTSAIAGVATKQLEIRDYEIVTNGLAVTRVEWVTARNTPVLTIDTSYNPITNAAVSLRVTETDWNNTQLWSQRVTTYDYTGSISTSDILRRSGQRETTEFNTSGEGGWFSRAEVIDTDGSVVTTTTTLNSGATVSRTRDATNPDTWQTAVRLPSTDLALYNDIAAEGAAIGTLFGTALAQAIPTDNVFSQVAVGSVLAAVGKNFGQAIDAGLSTTLSVSDIVGQTLADFSSDLAGAFSNQALGAVSGFLVGELAESLGFDGSGFGDQLLRSTAGSITNQVLTNATTLTNALLDTIEREAANDNEMLDDVLLDNGQIDERSAA